MTKLYMCIFHISTMTEMKTEHMTKKKKRVASDINNSVGPFQPAHTWYCISKPLCLNSQTHPVREGGSTENKCHPSARLRFFCSKWKKVATWTCREVEKHSAVSSPELLQSSTSVCRSVLSHALQSFCHFLSLLNFFCQVCNSSYLIKSCNFQFPCSHQRNQSAVFQRAGTAKKIHDGLEQVCCSHSASGMSGTYFHCLLTVCSSLSAFIAPP